MEEEHHYMILQKRFYTLFYCNVSGNGNGWCITHQKQTTPCHQEKNWLLLFLLHFLVGHECKQLHKRHYTKKNRLDTLGLYTHYMLLVWCKCNYFHFTFYQRSHNVTCYLLLENYHTNNNSNNAACSTLGA